jgi:hypothetical protein
MADGESGCPGVSWALSPALRYLSYLGRQWETTPEHLIRAKCRLHPPLGCKPVPPVACRLLNLLAVLSPPGQNATDERQAVDWLIHQN